MSESDHCATERPSPTPPPPAHPPAVLYVHENAVPQDVLNYQSLYRMPPLNTIVPQNLVKSEISTSCSLANAKNNAELTPLPQNFLAVTHGSIIDTDGFNYLEEASAKPGGIAMQNVPTYPSTTSSGLKRKLVDYTPRGISDSTASHRCRRDDSCSTGYTSDDSDDTFRRCQKCPKSRRRHKLGAKYSPLFNNGEVCRNGGRPLFKDEIIQDSPSASSENPLTLEHMAREKTFELPKGSEMGRIWEEKKLQLAERERQLAEAEEALKQQEEEAQEYLRLALEQQERALNEREAALRARREAVQRKLEQASKLMGESGRIVDPKNFKSGNFSYNSPNSYIFSRSSSSIHKHPSTNISESPFGLSDSGVKSQEPTNSENKNVLEGLRGGPRSQFFSDSKLCLSVGGKCESGVNVLTPTLKTLADRNDTCLTALPKLEAPVISSPSFSRSISLNANVKDKLSLSNVMDSQDSLPSLEPSKIVRTYTRAGRSRTNSEASSFSVVDVKTDTATTPQGPYISPVTESPHNCPSLSASSSCDEETIINGGSSVTITHVAVKSRSLRPFGAVPKLEVFKENEDECDKEVLRASICSGTVTESKPKEVSSLVVSNSQGKASLIPDHVKIFPPKIVSAKPVPPIDKSFTQIMKNECKIETVMQPQNQLSSGDIYDKKVAKGTCTVAYSSDNNSGRQKMSLPVKTVPVRRISISGCEVAAPPQSDNVQRCDISHERFRSKSIDVATTDIEEKVKSVAGSTLNTTDQLRSENLIVCRNTEDSSRLPLVTTQQQQFSVPQPMAGRKLQSCVKAEENQLWQGRPFLPGDIFYMPESKLDHQVNPVSRRDDLQSELDSKHPPSVQSPSEFSQSPTVQYQSLHITKKPSFTDNNGGHSISPQLFTSTDQSLKSHGRSVMPDKVEGMSFSSPPVQGGQSLSFIQGKKLTHISSFRGSPPVVSQFMPTVNQPVQTSSTSQIEIDSNLVRQSPHVPYVVETQLLSLPGLISGNHVRSSNIALPFSSSSSVVSAQGSHNTLELLPSQRDLREGQQKMVVETVSEADVVPSESSQKYSSILLLSNNSSHTVESLPNVLQTVSHGVQLDQEAIGLDQMENAQVIKVSEGLLQSQEPRSGCVTQWEPKNLNSHVSETLTNLGDYDPVSQTLTTSNPVFLQSILSNSISLSTEAVTNNQAETVDIYSSCAGESIPVQLQTEDLEKEDQKNELALHETIDIVQQRLSVEQRNAATEEIGIDGRNTEFGYQSQDECVSRHSDNEVELNGSDADIVQTHSGVTADHENLNAVVSDASRNLSDDKLEISRTDHFFISTGILRTQDLSRAADSSCSVQDEYLPLDESNLNENCLSDSDDGCEAQTNSVDTYIGRIETDVTDNNTLGSNGEISRDVALDTELDQNGCEMSNSNGGVGEVTFKEPVCGLETKMSPLQPDSEERIAQIDLKNRESDVVTDREEQKVTNFPTRESVVSLADVDGGDASFEKSQNGEFQATEIGSEGLISSEVDLNNCSEVEIHPNNVKNNSRNYRKKRGRGRPKGEGKGRKYASKKNGKLVTNHAVLNEKSTNLPLKKNQTEDSNENRALSEKDCENLTESDPLINKCVTNSKFASEDDNGTCDYEAESEKFEHVSHSGRKLKLNSYLHRVVSMGHLQKRAKLDVHSKPVSQPPVPELEGKRRRRKGGRNANIMTDPERKESKDDKVEGDKKSTTKKKELNLKCGKCGNVSETKAKFTSHVQHEHNGLARPEGESQEFSEAERKIILAQTIKSVKLKCEICSKGFKSVLGYKYHTNSCGYAVEELLTKCKICEKNILNGYLKCHLRKFHNLFQRKPKPPIPAPSPVPKGSGGRPRRQAATKCDAKLKAWHCDPSGTVEGSDALELDCDNELNKSYKKEIVHVPKDVQSKWKLEIYTKGEASCIHESCDHTFRSIKESCKHFTSCLFSNIRRKYKCKFCGASCESVEAIRDHVLNAHKELEDTFKESESDFSDEEVVKSPGKSLNFGTPKSAGKLGDSLRPFGPAVNWTMEFLLENSSKELFGNLTTAYEDWFPLNAEEAEKFVPPVAVSPKFKVSMVSKVVGNCKSTEYQLLNRFNSISALKGFALFSGGPVVSSAWCPLPFKKSGNERPQFLALSASSAPDRNYCVMKSYSHKGVIQIWKCSCMGKENSAVPEFQLAIAHEFGNVWSLAWCPSGVYDENAVDTCTDKSNLKRIGVLAAGCSDGTVRVFVMPSPKVFDLKDTTRIFKVSPKLTLKLSPLGEGDEQCLQIDWFRGKGHSYIAGAYSTGFVSVWDLNTSSPLLRITKPEGSVLYPIKCFLAHNGVCSSVAFCPTTGGRNLLSGGNDRTYKFWDLENTNMPLNICRKGLVTGATWLPHWAGGFVTFDDVFSLGNTHTCFKENGYYGLHSRNVLSSNSPVWTMSGSDWFNSMIQGDASGEVVITLQQQLLKNFDHDKASSKRKFPLLGVYVEKLAEGKRLSFRMNQEAGAQEKPKGKTQKKKSIPSTRDYQDSGEEGEAVGSAHYLGLPKTYSEIHEDYGVVFREQDCRRFSEIPEDELTERKRSERMEPGPLACYPLMSVTSVSWNSNFESCSMVFVGTQSGLCRIINVEALKSFSDFDWTKVIKKTTENNNQIKPGR